MNYLFKSLCFSDFFFQCSFMYQLDLRDCSVYSGCNLTQKKYLLVKKTSIMRIVFMISNVDCHSIKAAIEIYTTFSSPSCPSFPGPLGPCRKERLCTAGLGWCLFDMLLSSLFCHFHCARILGRVNPRAGLSFFSSKARHSLFKSVFPTQNTREREVHVCLFMF